MECSEFEDRLDRFLAGALTPAEQETAAAHVRSCRSCAGLARIARGECEFLDAGLAAQLTLAVLERTSGLACLRVEASLCDWVDEALGKEEEELLGLHVLHCPSCRSLAESLRELRGILPAMAELEPDEDFCRDVLEATVGRGLRAPMHGHRTAWLSWWQSLVRRPRFAWEAAYVGALLVFPFLGSPVSIPWPKSAATVIPAPLIDKGSRFVQRATTAVLTRQEAARKSVLGLENRGRSLLQKASELENRGSESLQEIGAAFLKQLRLDWKDFRQEKEGQNLR